MTEWKSLKYVVVDLEGNGHQPPDVVELAAVPIVDGVIGESDEWLVRPDQPITPFAHRIHGISNHDVEHNDTFADVKAHVLRALEADVLIAHNAHVDVDVLKRKLDDWECPEVFDTLKLARRLLPGLPTYKLSSLVEEFGLGDSLGHLDQPH
ncbi:MULTISPECIES: exonuclease domain-containing protein [Amycolatopsis]|uniref:3'-5' exonuclease n=1 Tax=Amycolatopsis TaxID=1813 RepID=UPI0007E0295D|nr:MULTISPECIES: exonuclease domain-containing protein [Amycolatopsis]OAP20452.1 Exodeoxyribonuclease 10 [Amycolatopsis sp. M39]